MTSEEAAALAERLDGIIGLLDAITSYLGPRDQVNLACAAVAGSHLDPAAVAEFTRLLAGGSTSWGAPGGNPWSCGGCGARYPGTVSPAPGGRCADCQALAAQNVIDDTGHAVNACTGPGWCVHCGVPQNPDGSHRTRSGAYIPGPVTA